MAAPTNIKDDNIDLIRKELETVKAERNKANTALAAAQATIKQLDEALHKASARLAAKAPKPLPDAASEAYQLAESATFLSTTGHIVTGLPGDLLLDAAEAEAKALQKKLGPGYRVHAVTSETIQALEDSSLLQE
jgi:hypothetical protein